MSRAFLRVEVQQAEGGQRKTSEAASAPRVPCLGGHFLSPNSVNVNSQGHGHSCQELSTPLGLDKLTGTVGQVAVHPSKTLLPIPGGRPPAGSQCPAQDTISQTLPRGTHQILPLGRAQ